MVYRARGADIYISPHDRLPLLQDCLEVKTTVTSTIVEIDSGYIPRKKYIFTEDVVLPVIGTRHLTRGIR